MTEDEEFEALEQRLNMKEQEYEQINHPNGVTTWKTKPKEQTSKAWVGLTEQEHTEIAIQCGCMSADWVFYGATIERILKEKNS